MVPRPHTGPVAEPPARYTAPPLPVSFALPADSGLELVETRHAPAPAASDEPADAPRPRRVRPPRPALPDEPLEIVETRKEPPPAP